MKKQIALPSEGHDYRAFSHLLWMDVDRFLEDMTVQQKKEFYLNRMLELSAAISESLIIIDRYKKSKNQSVVDDYTQLVTELVRAVYEASRKRLELEEAENV